jgi:hypothetical protein
MNKVVIILSLICVVGCATQQLARLRGNLHQKGFSDEYVDGYVDGCSSGYNLAGNYQFEFLKDVPRYKSQPLYAEGWDEGHHKCKTEYESLEEVFNTLVSD